MRFYINYSADEVLNIFNAVTLRILVMNQMNIPKYSATEKSAT